MLDETIAGLHRSATSLTKLVTELGDKASWSPLGKGRTALDQVAECALFLGMTAKLVGGQEIGQFDMEAFTNAKAALSVDAETALGALTANTNTLAEAVATLSPEGAEKSVMMPWGEPMTIAGVVRLTYWNNTYHEGQINYIQTLAD